MYFYFIALYSMLSSIIFFAREHIKNEQRTEKKNENDSVLQFLPSIASNEWDITLITRVDCVYIVEALMNMNTHTKIEKLT